MAETHRDNYLPVLEGIKAPLGVILYLIRRDNVDIYDIPIARITKEYLEFLDAMEGSRIELAGEFFVMAATLMRIKAQMLLRRDDDEDEDPRETLVRSLIEYKKMVEAARNFGELEEERSKVFQRPVPDNEKKFKEEPTIELNLFHLMKAFREVMTEFEAADVREIELEEYTIEEKIEAITSTLEEHGQVMFVDLFSSGSSRMELIVTFMALLELIKHSQVKFQQESAFGSIWLYRGDNFGQPITPEDPNATEEVAEPEGPSGAASVDSIAPQPTPMEQDGKPESG